MLITKQYHISVILSMVGIYPVKSFAKGKRKSPILFNRVAVISGVGAREYYKKLGYKLEDSYMVKEI